MNNLVASVRRSRLEGKLIEIIAVPGGGFGKLCVVGKFVPYPNLRAVKRAQDGAPGF